MFFADFQDPMPSAAGGTESQQTGIGLKATENPNQTIPMKPIKFILAIALGSFGVATHASADTFKIDPVHSSILFSVTHLGVSNLYGRFNDVSGTVTFDQSRSIQRTQ